IYVRGDSPRLRWFLDLASRLVPRGNWEFIPGWLEFNRQAHAPVISALEARQGIRAAAAMEAHVLAAGELLIQHFSATGYFDEVENSPDVSDNGEETS